MRYCERCGLKFGVLRHIFLRGEFCSNKCLEGNKRDEAVRILWEARHPELQEVSSPSISSDEARAEIWTGILRTAKYLGQRQLAPTKRRPPVALLQEGAREVPLYFLNAALVEFRLAQLMGPGHAIFGVDIPWPPAWRRAAAKNDTSGLPTMEQYVAPYAAAIHGHVQHSPCVLAGYSFAGIMAFETAHQIQQQGGKVEMVILLDAPAKYLTDVAPHKIAWQKLQEIWKPTLHRWPTDRTLQSIGARLKNSLFTICRMLIQEIKTVGNYFVTAVLRDPGRLTFKTDEMGIPLHWRLVERLYENALGSYCLRPVNCRATLFRATPTEDERALANLLPLGESLGWENAFSKGLEIIHVTGSHFTMVEGEASELARELIKLLRRFCSHISVYDQKLPSKQPISSNRF